MEWIIHDGDDRMGSSDSGPEVPETAAFRGASAPWTILLSPLPAGRRFAILLARPASGPDQTHPPRTHATSTSRRELEWQAIPGFDMKAIRLAKWMVGASLVLSSGCATVPAWERGELADPIMVLDENPIDAGIYEQHHEYREGSAGGTRAQRGGCGCG